MNPSTPSPIRILLLLFLTLIAPALASAQTTVTGHVKFPDTTAPSNTKVCINLQNFKPNSPRVIGTGTIVSTTNYCVTPAADGSFSFSVYGNNIITPSSTTWRVDFYFNGVQQSSATYLINHSPFNLDNETSLSTSTPAGPNQLATQAFPFTQLVAATVWTITHNLGNSSPIVEVYDASGNLLDPTGSANPFSIKATSANVITITFTNPQAGTATVMSAGPISIATTQPNAVLQNPVAGQTIGGPSLAIAAPYSTNAAGSHIGAETFGKINGICIVDGVMNATLAAAVTCAGTSGVIEIPMFAVPVLTANVTIPAGVTLRFDGPSGITTTGFTLTVNGPIVAPNTQIFFGTGSVILNGSLPNGIIPQWWGAKNDATTDDTAAIQSAITAACAPSTYKGGTIYFPPGAGYKTANISTSPFNITCNNLRFLGASWGQANSPMPPSQLIGQSLTVPMFIFTGAPLGTTFENLAFEGNPNSATASAISVSGNLVVGVITHNFFDQWGGPAITSNSQPGGWWITENFAQNCLMQRPASTDTGCFDWSGNDVELHRNFVTTSVPTAAGNIGTGHTYAYAIRGVNGFVSHNMGEISQHGWLVTGSLLNMNDNRCFLIQGNCLVVNGSQNIISGWKAIDVSQTANGSFDCFVFTNAETLGGNLLSNSQCEEEGSSNGNHARNAVTDNNGAGTGDINRNRYSNIRLRSNLATGVKFNFTGISQPAVVEPHVSGTDRGNASATVQCGLDAETQVWQTVLTANQTATTSTTGAYNGCRFRFVRGATATGAFNLTVTCNTSLALSTAGSSADCEFINGVWRFTGAILSGLP